MQTENIVVIFVWWFQKRTHEGEKSTETALKERYQSNETENCRHRNESPTMYYLSDNTIYMLLLFNFLVFFYPWEWHFPRLALGQQFQSKYRQQAITSAFYWFIVSTCAYVFSWCVALLYGQYWMHRVYSHSVTFHSFILKFSGSYNKKMCSMSHQIPLLHINRSPIFFNIIRFEISFDGFNH